VGRFIGDNGEVSEWTWATPEPQRLEALFELATQE
jgi:hypothetical protein